MANFLTSTRNLYGKKIFLLGTSNLGPVNTPIRAISASHVKSVFGTDGTLLDAYRVIRETMYDCEVYLVKVTGVHSEAYLNINLPNGIAMNAFYLKAKSANEIFDNIKIIIDNDALYLYFEGDTLGDYKIRYPYAYEDDAGNQVLNDAGYPIYKTMYDLAEEINEDTRTLNSEVYCYVNCEADVLANSALVGVNPMQNKMNGGNSGLYYNKNMLYNCLSDTYAILEGRDIDIILPLGVYYDDTCTDNPEFLSEFYDTSREYLTLKTKTKYLSYYEQLLTFCRNQMQFGMITHGIMGFNLINDPFVDEDYYIDYLKYFKGANEVAIELQKYKQLTSVCVGDLYTTFGTRVSNSYIAYAALVADLAVTANTTNKPLPKSFTMFNDFSSRNLNKIRDIGFTALRYSIFKKCVVVANGITTSDDKNFKFLCNVRMCQLAMSYLKEVLSLFIGKNINVLMKTKELEQKVISLLNELVNKGVISGFMVNSITNPNTGHVMLDLSFKTLYMNEYIKAYSGLAAMMYGGDYE
jgi:hypothetical protein